MSRKPEIRWATKPLALPIDWIVTEYRQAKDPKKIIDILADQCSTKPCRIAWILNRCGMTVPVDKMPRALRSEKSFDYVAYWETSEDAAICDRLAEQMRAAQSMPGFDEPEVTVPEMIKPYPAGAVEPGKTGCAEEKETEREGETVAAERMFETDSQFIKRVTEEYGVPDDDLAEEDPPETEDLIAGLWEVFLQYRAKIGKGALSVADVLFMQALARDAREMEWED